MKFRWDGLIALVEMTYGLAGVVLLGADLAIVPGPKHFPPPAALLGVLFFVAAAAAGWLLWRDRRAGFGFSAAVQILQLPVFTWQAFQYSAQAGPAFVLLHTGSGWIWRFAPGIHWQLPSAAPAAGLEAGLNLLALASLIAVLSKLRAETRLRRRMGERGQDREELAEVYVSRFRRYGSRRG